MIPSEEFVEQLARRGFGVFSGVPCSYLTPLINTVITSASIDYVGATNEGDAVAVVAGAELAGRRGVVLFQNSGLGNAVNPFTSLTETFRIPMLVLCTWRGQPGGAPDEPQHDRMGRITLDLFERMGIPAEVLPATSSEVEAALDRAGAALDRGSPAALVIPKGILSGDAVPSAHRRRDLPSALEIAGDLGAPLDPDAALQVIHEETEESALLATTGFTGRALYARGDRANHFYMVGSMGCIASLGLGITRAAGEVPTVVLDGDGSLLMRLGALATIGFEAPGSLTHILLDNEVHDSTGAQATVSPSVDFATIALACGYRSARRINSLDALRAALQEGGAGPRFLHVRTAPRPDRKLPRPTITPPEVAERLRGWLRGR